MSKSGYKQWEITEEGLSKMTWTLGNLVGKSQNYLYSDITVKEIVPDSEHYSSAGRLVLAKFV